MINKLITSLNTGVIQFDADGTIKDYNPAVEKLIGVKPKIKQRLSAFTDSIHAVTEDGEMLREPGSLDKLLNSMQSIIISPFAGSEKERKRIKLQILGESGTNSITYLIFEDLSDKKSHDEISTLLDTCETVHKRIHLGVWEHDVVTEEVYWSEELYYLFYRDIELGPPNYSEFTFSIHADDRYEVDEHFQRSLIEGVSCNMDYRTNPTIGPMRYLNTQFSCIMSNNQVVKIYGSNRDITDSVLASKTPERKMAIYLQLLIQIKSVTGNMTLAVICLLFETVFIRFWGLLQTRWAVIKCHLRDIVICSFLLKTQ